MLFNSFEFLLFLPVFFTLYWILNKYTNKSLANILILIGSYIFYGWWDYRFLFLIILSSIIDFFVGIQIEKSTSKTKRKLLLAFSLTANLGMLVYFKYANFFIDNFVSLLDTMSIQANVSSLQVILPVGISFYTFQTLSYSIDVYRGNLKASKNAVSFFAYVSFFPQLVAGPIERATNLLPQFSKDKKFEYASARNGMQQILWGLFKKVVVADNCATIVNEVFANYETVSSGTLVLGAILFAFQIYGDFSGYSDIAIGSARLLGFNLNKNFAYPYFSRDIAEFWRRWHISLSTWFRDYLYIPLGGSKGSKWVKVRNTFIIFIVSGFWHGANWTFVIWGALNALYFLPLLLRDKNRRNLEIVSMNRLIPRFREILQIIFTFILTTIAWVFFRAESVEKALVYLKRIFLNTSYLPQVEPIYITTIFFPILLLIVFEWLFRTKNFGLEFNQSSNKLARYFAYSFVLICVMFLGSFESDSFIYFQF